MDNATRTVRFALVGALAFTLLATIIGTATWPLTGDASLMHYVVFLMKGGSKPYRDIIDVNLPGTYFFEALGMALFGNGAAGLRRYDCAITACVMLGCVAVTGRKRWLAGVIAGLLFALVHLQDGVAQQTQRDLLLTPFALAALALFRLLRTAGQSSAFVALLLGLSFGVTFVIKPVLLPFCLLLLSYGLYRVPVLRQPWLCASMGFGLIAPMLIAFVWLVSQHCLANFRFIVQELLPLHAKLGQRPLIFLLNHSFSPLGLLLALTLLAVIVSKQNLLEEWSLLFVAVGGTLLSYLLQGKGYSYQRYPLIAVLLITFALVLENGLLQHGKVRSVAYLMACWAGCLGISFGWKALHIAPDTPFVHSLSHALHVLGDSKTLDGQVQCLDTFGGCVNTLYDLRVRQSTGYLYDCYLFTEPSPARMQYREHFQAAWIAAKPKLVVLTSQNCFTNFSDGYGRLATWPALDTELHTHYREVSRWTASGPTSWLSAKGMPFGYRLLERTDP